MFKLKHTSHLQVELKPGETTIEPEQSINHFMLPEQYILPTAEEMFQGLLVVANHVMSGTF